jgi:histidyl-tRNA synthetase
MTNNALKIPINSTVRNNSTAKSNPLPNRSDVYNDSRMLDVDNRIKERRRFRRADLHWEQIPRANAPNKLLQEKAVNLLSTIVSKLQNKEEVVLNHSHLTQITQCEKDQNVNLLKQLADILDISYHAKVTIRGKVFRCSYIIRHTETGYAVIDNEAVLLTQPHFVGKKSVAPKTLELGGDNGNA